MRTPQWIKNQTCAAGEELVACELRRRNVVATFSPRNFPGKDILISTYDASRAGHVEVKTTHADRADTFLFKIKHEAWVDEPDNQIVALVWLGSVKPGRETPNRIWLAYKREIGKLCQGPLREQNTNASNTERRLDITDIPAHWENRWSIVEPYATVVTAPPREPGRRSWPRYPANAVVKATGNPNDRKGGAGKRVEDVLRCLSRGPKTVAQIDAACPSILASTLRNMARLGLVMIIAPVESSPTFAKKSRGLIAATAAAA